MISKRKLTSTMAVILTMSNLAYADVLQHSERKNSTVQIDRDSLNQAEAQRRKDLLAHAEQLKAQYQQTFEVVANLNQKLEAAKNECKQECSSEETQSLLNSVADTSEALAGTVLITNQLRMAMGGMASGSSHTANYIEERLRSGDKNISFGDRMYSNSVKTNFTPHKTFLGRLFLGTAVVSVLAETTQSFLDNKDKIYKDQIESLQEEIKKYLKEAGNINANMSVVTTALSKSIQVIQTNSNTSSTSVGVQD